LSAHITRYTKRHDDELKQMLKEKGITIAEDLDGRCGPQRGICRDPEGVTHRDYVTHAWTEKSRQGSAGQDGGNARADEDGGRHPVARER